MDFAGFIARQEMRFGVEHGNDEDGADAEAPGKCGVDTRIGFGVAAKLRSMRADAGSGEAIASIEREAEIGSMESGGGAADHFIAAHKSQGGGAGVRGIRGADDEFIEHKVESEIGRESGLDVLLEKAREIGLR
jgi:hypothetical protein